MRRQGAECRQGILNTAVERERQTAREEGRQGILNTAVERERDRQIEKREDSAS